MYFNEQSLDGLNTIYCDELFIGGELFTSGTGPTGDTGPQGIAGSSSSVFPYKAETISLSPPISNSTIEWNNAVQTSSTIIYISHLNLNNIDIDPILNLIQINDTFIIQTNTDSTKYKKWTVTSNSTFSTYTALGVSLISSTFSFAHNDNVDLFLFRVGPQGATGSTGLEYFQEISWE